MQQYNVDKQLQSLELEILKEFHSVCEKHGLCYYLVYGTMLGAVRHQGFIPWDDDIDVAMPREAYEILRCNADKWFPGWLKFCCYQNTSDYPYNLAKLEHQNTTLIESEYDHLSRNGGVYIDVFPLDGMPARPLQRKLHYYTTRLLQRITMLMCCNGSVFTRKKNWKGLFKAILANICQAVFSEKRVHACFDKYMQKFKYDTSEYIASFEGSWGFCREIIKKVCFGKPTLILFEGFKFSGVEKPEEYLSHVYGDFMSLPPLEKRISHHDFNYNIKHS